MSTPPTDEQLHDIRAAVIAIVVALGAALPMTPDVRATVGRLMDTEHDHQPPQGG
ncbi:hypothetical protein SEA_PAITO_68 [Mycobacterium phage Paito]|uniref:Uncharacterized protein n=1 Tax=Mycobacterium phage Paito TaxID=2315544 RepID=A0A386KH24_9CAUD|nr:hypothetical protein KDW68_gp68 [Mycobacterium phage Paito]AYD84652.1 hypothetical protein SEA_PAITO_68 [Mycobacterium phage Paito]